MAQNFIVYDICEIVNDICDRDSRAREEWQRSIRESFMPFMCRRSAMLSPAARAGSLALVKIKIRRESTWSMRNFAATG